MHQGPAVTRLGLAVFACALTLYSAPDCARCHPHEAAAYAKSPMGNSIGTPAPQTGATIVHKPSGARITVAERDGIMTHSLASAGLEAQYPIAYEVGAGKIGHTYIVRVGDYLFESPASWYRQHGWDVSPGYQFMSTVGFDRVVESACMFCHAGNATFTGSDGRRLTAATLTAITCERCHGPGEEHARQPSAKNIVNPSKLTQRARNSICEQCHLEGETRLLNPGKTWQDFRPGREFESTAATYFLSQEGGHVRAVGQVEQLAESKCVRSSGGKLWCATCHNPHAQSAAGAREIRDVCTSCHASLSKAAHASVSECTSCHMPRLTPDDIPHSASTDHRILRRPVPLGSGSASDSEIVVWQDPPSQVRERDLAVASLVIGAKRGLTALRDQGVKLIEALPQEVKDNDPAILSSLVSIRMQRREPEKALAAARRALEVQPDSGFASLSLAIALQNSGDEAVAERQFLHTIDLDPSLDAAWTNLAFLYDRQGRKADRIALLDRYLKWNPQSIWFHQLKTMTR